MAGAGVPFVKGWNFVQTLGEGAYGEVKLAINSSTNEAIAVKVINNKNLPEIKANVEKEIRIHRMLHHENIVRYYGHRSEGAREFIFLEYLAGGELFDRIEPDMGMELTDAKRHFSSILAGVEYLHKHGVAHRDLKPENMLLDYQDVLKISDFGLATVYRYQGRERMLETYCGTAPYLAPEVVAKRPYRGDAVDIWSCGIVLVALLAGELPWDTPSDDCREYTSWKEGGIILSPWNKIDNLALSLIRKILVENPGKRLKIEQIKQHKWLNRESNKNGVDEKNVMSAQLERRKRICLEGETQIAMSQPVAGNNYPEAAGIDANQSVCFSQPPNLDDLVLESQLQCTPGTQSYPSRLVKRMTRFFVTTNVENTVKRLTDVMEAASYVVNKLSPGQLTVTTVDRRKSQLIFKAFVMEMAGNILVDFRLSKGDGLEFKRCFMRVKKSLESIINTPVQVEASAWARQNLTELESTLRDDKENIDAVVGVASNNPPDSVIESPCHDGAEQNANKAEKSKFPTSRYQTM